MLTITNEDNMALMARYPDKHFDIICIDPPYLYLKNQKLERVFDEQLFFAECKRLLTNDGFIIMFGRGSSFYRWNTILDSMGFNFKEEIIWYKSYSSSPALPISRVHETISILSKGNGKINRVRVPYIEQKGYNIDGIIADINRITSAIGTTKNIKALSDFLNTKIRSDYNNDINSNFNVSVEGIKTGRKEINTLQSIEMGMNEKSIVKVLRDHYATIHPTQKPVRLIERLINLCLPDKLKNQIIVADFFGGSMSTMEACHNIGVNGISCEIDTEYFNAAMKRINQHTSQTNLFL